MGVFSEGTLVHPGLSMPLCLLQCKLSQHHAIGLQTDCMVTVPAPVVRLLDMPYGPRLWVATPVIIIFDSVYIAACLLHLP